MPFSLPQLSRNQASVIALGVFVITILSSFFLPGYTIILSGLLVVIFLSIFVEDRGSTIIAGALSAVCVILHSVLTRVRFSTEIEMRYIYVLVLIFFTTLIVLYIKKLILRLQYDKSHINSLFENATEGFVITDDEGNIVLVNPSACRIFGYTAEEMSGQKIEMLIPEQFKRSHVQLRDAFYKEPQNRTMGHGRELFGRKKNGSNFPVEVSLSTYLQNNNRYVIAFIVDITRRKEIEQNMMKQQKQLERVSDEMRRLNSELEAKVEERTVILKEALQRLEQSQEELSEALDKERQLSEIKSRFVSMASHEFRTPLSTVLSSASLLARYTTTEDQEKRQRHIEKIKGSVKHLNDLLDDFLSLGKLDEGKVGADFGELNLFELVGDTIDEMKGLAKKFQNIEYEHSGPEAIESDKKLIKNILINLISNAIKFSDEGKTIHVASLVRADEAVISVKDEGIGISKEDQAHLFSSFFRGKNALNIQGTGLGLHIVKRYLDLLGGEVNLKSEIGNGTIITFTIPVNYS
ncbi:MAG: PAS domain S-box protein [Flavisolibacter sp.]